MLEKVHAPSQGDFYVFTACLLVIGLTLQGLTLQSDAWVKVEKSRQVHRSSTGVAILENQPINSRILVWEEIVRAGIWRPCYIFPHLPPNHTAPYCADFAEDFYHPPWLTNVQILCVLSPSLTLWGSLFLTLSQVFLGHQELLSWLGSRLLMWSGISGVSGVIYFHTMVSQEFLVYCDVGDCRMFTAWAFHGYLDGSLVVFSVGLLCGSRAKPRKAARTTWV